MFPSLEIWAWLQISHIHFMTLDLEPAYQKFLEVAPAHISTKKVSRGNTRRREL